MIEHTFGVLKRGFAYLSQPVRTKLETTKNIIKVSVVLHNIAILQDTDPPEIGKIDELLADTQEVHTNIANGAFYIRNSVMPRWS